jgi:hemoglobin
MMHLLRAAAAALLAGPLVLGAAYAEERTLYERLGGYDGIAELTDALIDRMRDEKFDGFSDDSLRQTRQHIVDFICEATGGPCFYMGRDMETTHAGLGVTQAEWDNFVMVFGQTMDDLGIPEDAQADLAEGMMPFEEDIVEAE